MLSAKGETLSCAWRRRPCSSKISSLMAMGVAPLLSLVGALRTFDMSRTTEPSEATYSCTAAGRAQDSRAITSRISWSTGQRKCSSRLVSALSLFDFLLSCASSMATMRKFGSSKRASPCSVCSVCSVSVDILRSGMLSLALVRVFLLTALAISCTYS